LVDIVVTDENLHLVYLFNSTIDRTTANVTATGVRMCVNAV
jgi:hypothetical protein